VWHILPSDQNADLTFDSLVSEFNANHDSIKIESDSVKGLGTLKTRLQQTSRADWPDVIISAPAELKEMADATATIEPAECPGGDALRTALLPGIAAAYSMNGRLQAVPYGVSTPVLLFDAKKMRAAGLDPAHPPTTPEALFAASKQIVDRGTSPFGLVVYDWYSNFFVNQWSAQRGELVATPNNGRDGQNITVDFDTPANRAAMQWIVDVVNKGGGAWIAGGVPHGYEDLTRIIQPANGAVMTIHTSGSVGDILTMQGKGALKGVELGVGPMPGPAAGGLVGGNAMWLIDHQSAQRAGAAWQAIQWLVDPAQLARFDVATGYVPPSEAVAADPVMTAAWTAHPQLKVAYDQLHAMPDTSAAAGVLYGPSSGVDAVFWNLSNSIVDRHADPAAALIEASTEVNSLIAQYRGDELTNK
jgi:sn-glycerol 3-phosphate transport system substrate-binding protein